MVSIAAPFITLGPAYSDVGFSVVPLFPLVVTVGQTGLPASVEVVNNSNGAEAGGPITISNLTLVPSCGAFIGASDCPGPSVDPDVFALSATGVGEAGTACAGQTFTIANIDQVQDKYSFTPVGPAIMLQPPGMAGDRCRINFTIGVLKRPTKDASAATAGIQTTRLAGAAGMSNVTGALNITTGAGLSTVNAATPGSIATSVSPPPPPGGGTPTVNVGSTFSDTATVTGVANGPVPGGTVTFAYFFDPAGGPTQCAGALIPIGDSAVTPGPAVTPPAPPTGMATSASIPGVPPGAQPGTYHFVATYNGDANYAPLPQTACGAAGENVIVKAQPTIMTVASSSNASAPAGTATVPETVSDRATVTGATGAPVPTGTVTFTSYFDPPNAAPCSGTATTGAPVALVPASPTTATATSAAVAPTLPGTVRFVAVYNGDGTYMGVTSPCNATGENVSIRVTPRFDTLARSSNSNAPAGTATTADTVTDTATITGPVGAPDPTGTVIFTRYFDPPNAPPCSGPSVTTGAIPVVAPVPSTNPPTATASTPPFAPGAPGTVRYTASYSGDASYAPVLTTACEAPGESVTVTAMPGFATMARSSDPANPAGSAAPGTTITDTATVTGVLGGPTPTGTVIFTRYFDPPGTAACASLPTVLPTATLTPPGLATVPPSAVATTAPFTPTGPGTVRFRASYSGDASYAAVGITPCDAPGETILVQAMPTLVTVAASSNTADAPGTASPNATVSDKATVTGTTGLPAPSGTVTFTRYFDPPNTAACSSPPTVLAPVTLTLPAPPTTPPSAVATTPAFTPPGPGTVRFRASYSGDTNYGALPITACDAPGESVVVQAVPGFATLARSSDSANPAGTAGPGATVADTATVTGVAGGPVPTGSVTFTRYFDAPLGLPCSGAPTVIGPLTLSPASPQPALPTAVVTTPPFAPPGPGTVRFRASYGGDTFYRALPDSDCGAAGENVVVSVAPGFKTLASSSNTTRPAGTAVVGDGVRDVATVTGPAGAPTPTGTVIFTRYFDAPNAAPCSGMPTVLAPVTLTAPATPTAPPSATATSPSFTTTGPGTVRFRASYGGDTNYAPIPNTDCGAAGENVTVAKAAPSITTKASVTAGNVVTDKATVTGAPGAPAPTGNVLFQLYGTNTCTGTPAFQSTNTLQADGTATSTPFTLPSAGVYHFVATYSGDDNNSPAGPTACLDADETVGVGLLPVQLTTDASDTVSVNQAVFDVATITATITPTGTITFKLYGPDDATCARPPIFTSNKTVTANGQYTSDSFTPTAPGTYRWVATYSGDPSNAGFTTACDDPLERVVVTPLPTIGIVKTADPLSLPVPGGTFTFTLVITNTGTVPLTITTLTDDKYPLLTIAGTTCNTAIGTMLAPGGTYRCQFPGPFTGPAGAAQTDVATVTGVDNRNNTVNAHDDAVVTITPLPTIAVDKTATPLSLPVPGGTFTFPVVVTNTGPVALTIRTLTDDKYGDVTKIPGSTCANAVGTVLAPAPGPGNTYSCSFPGPFIRPVPDTQTDVVTVTAQDSRGITVQARDDAVVTITPLPSILTTKTASPTTLPEPGGSFTFDYSVTNTGPEAVTITAIIDDVYGNLNGRGTCAIGARLVPGATYRCSFSGNFFGNAGAPQTDTISTTARDDRGQSVISLAKATVRITDVPPSIRVEKTPNPVSRPEPGGTFRFTVKVTNTSFEPVVITSLTDDIYGDLNGRGSCSVGIGLAPNGGSYSCAFDGEFRGKGGDSQTDTVTAKAVDDEGTVVTAMAKATVFLTPVGTPIVAPPPVVVQQIPPAPQILVRTGSDLAGKARLAGLFLLVGMTLVVATRNFGGDGPGLAPAASGPDGPRGAGSGGGGHWFGNDNWFGGARVHPPRGPAGGLGGGAVVEPPPAPPVPDADAEPAWDVWLARSAAPAAPPAPVAPAPSQRPAQVWPAPVTRVERTVVEPASDAPASDEPPILEATVVRPEVVVPTVVNVRATNGLDAAALDAAQAMSARPRPPAGPAGRGKGRRS